jgi:hypothetical protein
VAEQTGIHITGIIDAEIESSHRGGSLRKIPFQLSSEPDGVWEEIFIHNWNHPPTFTSMHRSGIARIEGDRVILDGTTVDEVARVHQTTLKLVVEETNRNYTALLQKQREKDERDAARRRSESAALEAERMKARDISFD